MTPFPALAAHTPFPTPRPHLHSLGKRHYYTCGSTTLAWQQEWYTAPFYTASSSSYDAAASLGPVNPPGSVLRGATECRESAVSGSRSASGVGVVVVTRTSGGLTFERTVTSVLAGSASSTGVSSTSTSAGTVPASSITASPSSALSTTVSPTSISPSSSPSVVAPGPVAQNIDPSSTNHCAGDLDFQAWGAITGAAFTVLVGGLLWLLWAILRGRIPAIYSPRTYFVPSDARPSKSFSFLAFFFPFLPNTNSPPGSAATSALPVVLASLKLLALSSLVALGAALPLFAINNPCISETSPANYLGGRLGTLTDLSLLRLLNSLDPAPESASREGAIFLLQSSAGAAKRALPQTIGPALSSARVRLIIVLVLIGLLSLVGGLWIVTRAYAQIWARRRKFEQETCGGMEMVVVAAKDAPGWVGTSEEKLRKMLVDDVSAGDGDADEKELSVVGVFGIPDTKLLRAKVAERETALLHLEAAEAEYLLGNPTQIRAPSLEIQSPHSDRPFLPRSQTADTLPPLLPSDTSHAQYSNPAIAGPSRQPLAARQLDQSRFREINRNSLQSIRFELGQRVKVDEKGRFVPDPSPESEGGGGSLKAKSESGSTSSERSRSHEAGETTPDPKILPGPERQLELHPSPPYRSHQPSAVASPATHPSSPIERARLGLKALNDEVENLQLQAMRSAATGTDIVGWVIVGRGVRFLPGSTRIEGWTIEDIDWRNIGKAFERVFWVRVALLGLVGIDTVTLYRPYKRLCTWLRALPAFPWTPRAERRIRIRGGAGFRSRLGNVPGGSYSYPRQYLLVLAHRVPTVSRSRRDTLATQATFWILLALCIFWALLVAALEFAVQALNGEAQKARAVGDGSIYSTWWIFVFLLNIAIILPAIILLQPRRLITYLHRRRKAKTPRTLFRASQLRPLSPALLLGGPLLAVLYTLSLSLIFPLLCIPLLVLLYLSFVVLRHMTDRVFVDYNFDDGRLALWLVRRLGWCLGIQPLLYGLILLSRREWAIGGVSCGVAVLAVVLSEALTARRIPERRQRVPKAATRSSLEKISAGMRASPARSARPGHSRAASDSSMLQRLTTLLPGYSRLPASCPLPLRPHTIDDMTRTELASVTRRDLTAGREKDGDRFFHDPTETKRGLVYPPEMLQPPAVVWLPYTPGPEAEAEAAELEGLRGLVAIVDPAPRERRRGEK